MGNAGDSAGESKTDFSFLTVALELSYEIWHRCSGG